MSSRYFIEVEKMEAIEMVPGYLAKLAHTPLHTINIIDVEAGAPSAMHSHPQEQLAFVLEGQFEMTVGDETKLLEPGTFCFIPGNVVHGGKAITRCRLLDVFSPIREDFKEKGGLQLG